MNNLILRTTNSPYGDINKGSVLAQSELDGNFVSLKGEVIYTCTTSNDLVTFTKYNGESFTFSIGTDCVFVTYSEFYNLITTSSLIPHQFYNITNFQTIFDVPDFYINGDAKGNYTGLMASTGLIESIIVYTTSVNTIDSQAYQPAWPNDMIKYDWTFTHTEVTSTPAFGRISERIDSDGNRTDYDHRNVFFIRYETYQKGNQLTGVITDMDGTNGFLKGFGTSFSSPGEITTSEPIIIDTKALFGYDVSINITTIVDDETLLFDYDLNIPISFAGESLNAYQAIHTGRFNRYKEFYISQNTDGNYVGLPTFLGDNLNNYMGDFVRYKSLYGFDYILSNNLFAGYTLSNKFGDRTYNNTFSDNFVNNTFGNDIANNFLESGFASNVIGDEFQNNIFSDICSDNVINNKFQNNIIGSDFKKNIISNNFQNNTIDGGFTRNQILNDFYDNKANSSFQSNMIYSQVFSIDFSLASYVYQPFTCEIIANSIGDNRLRYTDPSDNLIYSAITD